MTKTTTEDRDGYRITTVDHTVPDETFEAAVKELWRVRWAEAYTRTVWAGPQEEFDKIQHFSMRTFYIITADSLDIHEIQPGEIIATKSPPEPEIETFVAPSGGHDWDLSIWRDGGTDTCRKCGMDFAYFMGADEPSCVCADNPPHRWINMRNPVHVGGEYSRKITKQCINCGETVFEACVVPYGPCKSNSQES